MTLPTLPGSRNPRRLIAAGFFLLAGCAAMQFEVLRAGPGLPARAELQTVPHFAQQDYHCGPAALAMVFAANGEDVTPERLAPEVFLPARQGTLQAEMLAGTRRHGYVALQISPQLADVLAEVAAGHPVIVLQNLAFHWYPVWHYAVVVGYDLEAQAIVLRSGRDRRLELPMRTFEYTWGRSGYWAMVALAPPQLPASGAAADFVAAVAKLERAGRLDSAQRAYTAALERWPDHLMALVGLGNAAYASGNLAAAERAYRRAVLAHPASSAGWNNLAQALADLGRYREAAAAARRAVALGGPNLPTAKRTLDAIPDPDADARSNPARAVVPE